MARDISILGEQKVAEAKANRKKLERQSSFGDLKSTAAFIGGLWLKDLWTDKLEKENIQSFYYGEDGKTPNENRSIIHRRKENLNAVKALEDEIVRMGKEQVDINNEKAAVEWVKDTYYKPNYEKWLRYVPEYKTGNFPISTNQKIAFDTEHTEWSKGRVAALKDLNDLIRKLGYDTNYTETQAAQDLYAKHTQYIQPKSIKGFFKQKGLNLFGKRNPEVFRDWVIKNKYFDNDKQMERYISDSLKIDPFQAFINIKEAEKEATTTSRRKTLQQGEDKQFYVKTTEIETLPDGTTNENISLSAKPLVCGGADINKTNYLLSLFDPSEAARTVFSTKGLEAFEKEVKTESESLHVIESTEMYRKYVAAYNKVMEQGYKDLKTGYIKSPLGDEDKKRWGQIYQSLWDTSRTIKDLTTEITQINESSGIYSKDVINPFTQKPWTLDELEQRKKQLIEELLQFEVRLKNEAYDKLGGV